MISDSCGSRHGRDPDTGALLKDLQVLTTTATCEFVFLCGAGQFQRLASHRRCTVPTKMHNMIERWPQLQPTNPRGGVPPGVAGCGRMFLRKPCM